MLRFCAVNYMQRRDFIALLGGVFSWPFVAHAQKKATPVIGFIGGGVLASNGAPLVALRQGLGETGYVAGQTVKIEYRWAEDHYDRLPALAADLVGRKVDVILAGGDSAARAAKNATETIPIVFSVPGDPVAAGLVASFARPGGNLTGVSNMFTELIPKRLELLADLAPQASVFALLVDPGLPGAESMIREGQEAARVKGMQLHILKAGIESEIDAAFATLDQLRVDALVVNPSVLFYTRRDQLVALAARHAVPASYFQRDFAAAGGLISYGPNVSANYRLLGTYAGKILNGAKPADLPVEQPTRFELVVNLKTAEALGLTVPPAILARADEVIE
jgi:putative ABC transport system substrate-binding protein